MMAPSLRKILALEVADGRSSATKAAEGLTFLSGGNQNRGASAAGEGALASCQVADDDTAKSFDDLQ